MQLNITASLTFSDPDTEEPDWSNPQAKEDFTEVLSGMIDPIGDNLTLLDWQIVPEESMIVPKRNIHEEPAHKIRNLLTALQLHLDRSDARAAEIVILAITEQTNRAAEFYNKHEGR